MQHIKWFASSGWSSSLYRPTRNKGRMTVQKRNPLYGEPSEMTNDVGGAGKSGGAGNDESDWISDGDW